MVAGIANFYVYGEAPRPLEVGFIHVETVMARVSVHSGKVLPHLHEQMAQITYWLSGSGVYRIEDRSFDFAAPAVSFVPSGMVHGFTITPDADAVVVSIADSALPAISSQVMLALDQPLMLVSEGPDPQWDRLGRLVAMIHEEYASGRPDIDRLIPPLTAAALNYIWRLNAEGRVLSAQPTAALAVRLRRLVDRHFREDWPIGWYVDELATTPHLLAKACHAAFAKTVKELILERKLLEAKRLLLFTIRPVEQICFELGFQDTGYFSRFFRARTGKPPGQWRHDELQHNGKKPETPSPP